jgi:hypothetical protein
MGDSGMHEHGGIFAITEQASTPKSKREWFCHIFAS